MKEGTRSSHGQIVTVDERHSAFLHLEKVDVVLRPSQQAQGCAPIPQLTYLLLQLLQEALSSVLSRTPTQLNHLWRQRGRTFFRIW